jgi:enoyl-CoA hydratase/carnithine racemase
MGPFTDIAVDLAGHVATIEIRRPPHNFFDIALIRQIADACEALDQDASCRAIVLAAQGTAFCAGAKLGDGADVQDLLVKKAQAGQTAHLYIEAVRLFRTQKPIVGAIHGAAVGGGLGLALVPDLRVACPETRFCANFTKLGFHPGFGLTVTLPEEQVHTLLANAEQILRDGLHRARDFIPIHFAIGKETQDHELRDTRHE